MKALASAGASVIGCCRTLEKATESAANAGVPPERFTAVACELAEPKSVRAAVATVASTGVVIDSIIANAGIMAPPKVNHTPALTHHAPHTTHHSPLTSHSFIAPPPRPQLQTAEGIELQYMGNHIGHFIIVTGLLANLNPNGGRVVILSSMAHTGSYKVGEQPISEHALPSYHITYTSKVWHPL
jgi:WW domain-containing oxidoreductase